MNKASLHWNSVVSALVSEVETQCQRLGVPVIRGAFSGKYATIVRVEGFDWSLMEKLIGNESLCVLEYSVPPAPIDDNAELRDLHVYFRLKASSTWVYSSIETPEYDDPNETPEDEVRPGWRHGTSMDAQALEKLALLVAREEGFGGLKNRNERVDFAKKILEGTVDHELSLYDFWPISTQAETIYRIGIAPTTAKRLESEGYTVLEIARAMGITRSRVLAALETKVPHHIAILLKGESTNAPDA